MSNLQDIQNQKSFQYLLEVETVAQDILTEKDTKLDLSNARNKFREALRALEFTDDRKIWMQVGSVHIERSTKDARSILKSELANTDKDIDTLEDSIRKKVHKLRDLEHKPGLEGFTLKPISAIEAKALHKAFGTEKMSKRAAGLVIFRRFQAKIEYLLLQTSYGQHHWTPPKGHVDPGETDEMVTALRETVEESGLTKNDLKVYPDWKKVVEYKVDGKPKVVTYWLAELVDPKAKVKLSDEHQDFKWLEIEEACNYGRYKEMQDILRYFHGAVSENLS